MEISLADLVQMGKTAFDVTARAGQFFFPKVAVGRVDQDRRIEIGQYEGELEQFDVLLRTMAYNGPIDWIAHTADSYQFMADPHSSVDAAMNNRIFRGEVTISELFEDGDTRATEALAVVTLNRYGFSDAALIPYTRLDARKIQWKALVKVDGAKAVAGPFLDAMRDSIALSLSMV